MKLEVTKSDGFGERRKKMSENPNCHDPKHSPPSLAIAHCGLKASVEHGCGSEHQGFGMRNALTSQAVGGCFKIDGKFDTMHEKSNGQSRVKLGVWLIAIFCVLPMALHAQFAYVTNDDNTNTITITGYSGTSRHSGDS